MHIDNTDAATREMTEEFERFANATSQGAPAELASFIERWGGSASAQCPILSVWPEARLSPTPLWLAAMRRDRSCCEVLIQFRCALTRSDGNTRAQAWRYAAHNGWARESAALFAEQDRQGEVGAPDWPLVWEAVAAGCKAQSESLGERAAGWLGAILGPKVSRQNAKLFAALGKAVGEMVPGAGPTPGAQNEEWNSLIDAATAAWEPPELRDARSSVEGHPRARDLALARCSMSAWQAQQELDAMMEILERDGDEMSVMLEQMVGAVKTQSGAPGGELHGWAKSGAGARQWAASAVRLSAIGAGIPADALSKACENGQWTRAYALALAGASIQASGEPPLWWLARSRAPGQTKHVLNGKLAGLTGGAQVMDQQAVDVAQALIGAGARASDKGFDGMDALTKLRAGQEETEEDKAIKEWLGRATGGSMPPAQTLKELGLEPLEAILEAALEREQLEHVARRTDTSGKGKARL